MRAGVLVAPGPLASGAADRAAQRPASAGDDRDPGEARRAAVRPAVTPGHAGGPAARRGAGLFAEDVSFSTARCSRRSRARRDARGLVVPLYQDTTARPTWAAHAAFPDAGRAGRRSRAAKRDSLRSRSFRSSACGAPAPGQWRGTLAPRDPTPGSRLRRSAGRSGAIADVTGVAGSPSAASSPRSRATCPTGGR